MSSVVRPKTASDLDEIIANSKAYDSLITADKLKQLDVLDSSQHGFSSSASTDIDNTDSEVDTASQFYDHIKPQGDFLAELLQCIKTLDHSVQDLYDRRGECIDGLCQLQEESRKAGLNFPKLETVITAVRELHEDGSRGLENFSYRMKNQGLMDEYLSSEASTLNFHVVEECQEKFYGIITKFAAVEKQACATGETALKVVDNAIGSGHAGKDFEFQCAEKYGRLECKPEGVNLPTEVTYDKELMEIVELVEKLNEYYIPFVELEEYIPSVWQEHFRTQQITQNLEVINSVLNKQWQMLDDVRGRCVKNLKGLQKMVPWGINPYKQGVRKKFFRKFGVALDSILKRQKDRDDVTQLQLRNFSREILKVHSDLISEYDKGKDDAVLQQHKARTSKIIQEFRKFQEWVLKTLKDAEVQVEDAIGHISGAGVPAQSELLKNLDTAAELIQRLTECLHEEEDINAPDNLIKHNFLQMLAAIPDEEEHWDTDLR